MGWTRGDIEATIRLVTSEQRQALANRVRALMEDQNLDNVRLARASGVSEKTISRIINAKLAPRYSTLERLSRALGLAENELWVGIGVTASATARAKTPDPFPASPDLAGVLAQINDKFDQILANQARFDGLAERLDEIVGLMAPVAGQHPPLRRGRIARLQEDQQPSSVDRPRAPSPEAGDTRRETG